jgi:glutamyl-tRNA synthetase
MILSNYQLRLGWGHGDDEIITLEKAVEWFDIDHVGKARRGSTFKKLEISTALSQAEDPLAGAARGAGGGPRRMRLLEAAMPELKARAHDCNALSGQPFLFASRR